jgi:DNA-directed RNA polymerase specialized sigma24 family protein
MALMGSQTETPPPLRTPLQGSSAAVLDLFDRHGSVMLAVARHILGDPVEAEEALIEACVAMATGEAAIPAGGDSQLGRLCAWQRQVALQRLRRRLATPPLPAGQRVGGPDADGDMAGLRHQVVTAALANLPADQQQILQFAYGQGMDPATIGTVLRQPLTAVHKALGEALDRIALVVSHLWRRP